MTPREELFEVVKRIPFGKVCGYGAAGDALSRRMTGRTVGQCMATCPAGVPWWRVVAKDGDLPIKRRDPNLGQIQEQQLLSEGVPFADGKVLMNLCAVDPELLD